jgi:uncharacterized protein
MNGSSESLSNGQDFEDSSLYKGVYSYVEDYMSRYDMSHDFNHILRVLSFAKRILESEQENDSKTFDEQAIVLGALLHDVAKERLPATSDEQSRLDR